ncbi:unnamed protein product [Chrysodeixis includens]|uniref:Uncharacterized protein n=1 Tax=Chrysodeixis includens TaxID=689277 RepID=A0A9N8KW50_CHRIL|nr:unnamed protein product [Chrysodeixis includens]
MERSISVTVLPKLQYWRVVSSECCGAGGAAYTSDAVDRHLCSLRVPCERERRTRLAAAAPGPAPPAAPAPRRPTRPAAPAARPVHLQHNTSVAASPPPPRPPAPKLNAPTTAAHSHIAGHVAHCL